MKRKLHKRNLIKGKNSADKEQSSAKNKKPLKEGSDDECEWTPSQEDEMTFYRLEKIKRFGQEGEEGGG